MVVTTVSFFATLHNNKFLRVSLFFSIIVYHFLMREVAYSMFVGSSSIYLIIVRLSKPSVYFYEILNLSLQTSVVFHYCFNVCIRYRFGTCHVVISYILSFQLILLQLYM